MVTSIIERSVAAYLSNEDSPDIRNPIHSTAVAQKFGFAGPLVGGVTVYGWAADMILSALGEDWLTNGWADVAFKRPVYPGEQLAIRLEEDGDPGFRLTIQGPDGTVRVAGRVGLGTAPWLGELAPPETAAPLVSGDASTTPLTLATAPVGQYLRPVPMAMSAADAAEYARSKQHSEDERFVSASPLLHPAIIAGFETMMVYGQFEFSPGIHVSSQVQHLARPEAGEGYVATGKFIEVFEKNGRDYGVVDGSLIRNGVEVARARQVLIFAIH